MNIYALVAYWRYEGEAYRYELFHKEKYSQEEFKKHIKKCLGEMAQEKKVNQFEWNMDTLEEIIVKMISKFNYEILEDKIIYEEIDGQTIDSKLKCIPF